MALRAVWPSESVEVVEVEQVVAEDASAEQVDDKNHEDACVFGIDVHDLVRACPLAVSPIHGSVGRVTLKVFNRDVVEVRPEIGR